MEQNNNEFETAAPDPQKSGTAPPAPTQNDELKFPAMKAAEELMAKMDEKIRDIQARESALDAKLKAIDRAQAEARLSGFGIMRTEANEEEKKIAAARKLVAGTGLDPWPDYSRKK